MNKISLLIISFLFHISGSLISQNSDWTPPPYTFLEGKVSKFDGNIRYTVDSLMSMAERDSVITKTKEYIHQNLMLINESEFRDSIHIVLARDRDEMAKYAGGRIIGICMPKDGYVPENMIFCIYGTKHDALKHELMHMISFFKWGNIETNNGRALWLEEGLAVFANPKAEDCDGHTFKERYVYFLQNNKLLDFDSLFIYYPKSSLEYKIFYSQAAFITGYLLDNYGVEKLRLLWQSDVKDFAKIYEIKFENLISKINNDLNKKYLNPIEFNWVGFSQDCIE